VRISVIIPVLNEEHSIQPLLESLQSQTLTPAEIIVTDGGSTDRTPELVENYDRGALPIRLIRAAHAYPGRGRNLAAAEAANEWIAFIDAGVKPAPNWLESLAAVALTTNDPEVVYGSYEPVTETFFQECAAIAFVPPPVSMNGDFMRTRSTASVLMRRSVWQKVGGFPEDLRSAEDLLFMDRIEAASFRISHAPKAIVHWSIQPTLWKTFRRFVAYSHSNIRAGLWRSWQARIFQRYALLLLLVLVALFLDPKWLLLPIGLWLLMLLARALVASRRNAFSYPARLGRYLLRLIVIMPVLAVVDLAAIAGGVKWLLTDRSFTVNAGSVVDGA
jgi:glycosyltransferase involved in cell wall biosynthesis